MLAETPHALLAGHAAGSIPEPPALTLPIPAAAKTAFNAGSESELN
jgi:hypothetical protein